MSVESFKDLLRGIGRDVVDLDGIAWFNASPYLYCPIPFQLEVPLDRYDVDRLFNGRRIALRFAVPKPWGHPSFRLVVGDRSYDLETLSPKSRNQTRRGLESCTARQIQFSDLATQGIPLHVDTFTRQGRRVGRNTEDYWRRYFECAAKAECASAWAAFHGNEMAAYLIAITIDRIAHIVVVRSATRFLSYYPNNALLFSYVRTMMRGGSVDEISIGYESMQSSMGSLDHFKEGLGFKRREINRYVQLSPFCRAILRGPMVPLAKAMLGLFPRSDNARKVDGLITIYAHQQHLK